MKAESWAVRKVVIEIVIRPESWDVIDTLMKLAHKSIHPNLIKIVNRRKKDKETFGIQHTQEPKRSYLYEMGI